MTDLDTETADSSWAKGTGFDEFDYVPVSPWGPVALVLGIASLTALTTNVFGVGLAIAGTIVGIAAFFRIRSSATAAKGSGFAVAGAVVSVLCAIVGSMQLSHAYQNECPEGYQRVSFPNDISEHEFVFYGSRRRLSPEVAPLIGKKLFLKGFMWQTQKSDGLTEFVFLKDNGECCFGGEPKQFDYMVVRLVEGTTKAYVGKMVSVAGELKANVNAGEHEPVYTVDAIMVEEAQTPWGY